MATCKDCLHWEACVSLLESMGHTVDGDALDADKRCNTFESNTAYKELRKVMREFCKEYEKAKNSPFVHNPVGWALYRTWKKYE